MTRPRRKHGWRDQVSQTGCSPGGSEEPISSVQRPTPPVFRPLHPLLTQSAFPNVPQRTAAIYLLPRDNTNTDNLTPQLALAVEFQSKNFLVFATVRDLSKAHHLKDTGCEILTLGACDEEAVNFALKEVEGKLNGRGLNYLINNAGVGLSPLELRTFDLPSV